MEDHKRKNKKRNQNKKPTPEQIKKLHNNIEQKESKINGVTENGDEKANHSSSPNNGAPEPHEIKANAENHVTGETKKSKKKNKPKGKAKENLHGNETEDVNLNVNTETELEDTTLNNPSEKLEEIGELVREAEIISDSVKADISTSTDTNEHNGCSHNHSLISSPCSQYHSDEAPNCSHHIKHQLNKLKLGDFKIDFDVQKVMTPIATQSGASNQEYFYKGLNIDKLEVVNSEAPDSVNNEKMSSVKQINEIPLDESVTKLGLPVSIDSVVKNIDANPGIKNSAFVNPDEMMKSLFGNVGNKNSDAGFIDPGEMMKNMFENMGSKTSMLPNPEEILKGMFGNNSNQNNPNPDDLLKRVFVSPDNHHQTKSINPEELMKNMFGNLDNQKTSTGHQNSKPVDLPLDGVENTECKNVSSINPDDLMKNMFENLGNPMDMFGQMNAMVQQMDPNMMHSMNRMMSNMDPAVLSGMTNMVTGLMEGGGLGANLQNLMKMKAQKLQSSNKIEVVEAQSPTKSEGHEKHVGVKTKQLEINQCLETQIPENTKEIKKNSVDINEKLKVEISSNDEEKKSEKLEDPVLKCSFSLSSNASEKSEDEITEEPETRQGLSEGDIQAGPSKPKIFVREESVPELLENLSKVNKEEIKTKKVEIKTSKFKTILSKVLRKEKKTLAGETSISTTEIETQRVVYHENNSLKKNESPKEEMDYEKLHHVKEPMEARERKEIKTIPKRVKEIKDPARDEKETFKHSGEEKGQTETVNLSTPDNEIIAPGNNNFEFNLETMNAIFTNLLQGKELEVSHCDRKDENSGNENNDSLEIVPEKINQSTENSSIVLKEERKGNDVYENVTNSTNLETTQTNMPSIFSNVIQLSNLSSKETTSEKLPDFETMMNQMMKGFSVKASQINQDDNGVSFQSVNSQDNLLQNMQRSLMEQFAKKGEGGESGASNLLEGMSEMFDTLLTNSDESIPPDFNEFLGSTENISNILKMGEMLFGKSPFDLAEMNGEMNLSKETEHGLNDKNQTNNEDIKEKPISKNVYQHERPSFLLKELLGEEFWSVRKKRNNLTQKENPKLSIKSRKGNSKEKNKSTDSKERECPRALTKNATDFEPLPSNSATSLEMELEKESPFVRMMHRKIQKDSKLQQYLKEKLQKDPKMQKFIQEKLQKDERLQKIIQEKLSKDKNLRKTFEDKFKNELGLTGIIPKFDDDDDEISEDGKEKTEVKVNQKAQAHAEEDSAGTQKPKRNTALLIKRYAELTISLIVIVYVGILCY